MRIRGKTCLVTGGMGFIGSHTARELITKGARVIIVDRMSNKKGFAVPGAKIYKMDLKSPRLARVFKKEKPDYVYHFASNLLGYKTYEPRTDTESIFTLVNLLECAHHFGVKKVVFASSGIVYGPKAPPPTPETHPVDLANPYAISKFVVEGYLRFYKKMHGMPYVILRYPNVYGPGQTAGALADYIRTLRAGGQAEIRGDGKKTRDYVYIDDIARANVLALGVPSNFPEPTFNVGTGKETSLNQLYRTIAKLLGKKAAPIYTPERPGEQMRYSLDSKKIKRVLGWKPKVTLEQGLRKVIAAQKK